MESGQKPVVLFRRPLAWLDERENESGERLMARFGSDIAALENAINVLSFGIGKLADEDSQKMRIGDLKKSGDQGKLKLFATTALLFKALDSLHASRRLLLCGYFAEMLSCLRTMAEATRDADVCRQDSVKALEWLKHKEVRKSKKATVHPVVSRMMTSYDFLSQAGTHPSLISTIATGLGKPNAFMPTAGGSKSKVDEAVEEGMRQLLKQMNQSATEFLMYVNENCKINWDDNPEIKRKKDAILGI